MDPISISRLDDSEMRRRRGFWIKQSCGVLWNNGFYCGPIPKSNADMKSPPHEQHYTAGSQLCGNDICSGGKTGFQKFTGKLDDEALACAEMVYS